MTRKQGPVESSDVRIDLLYGFVVRSFKVSLLCKVVLPLRLHFFHLFYPVVSIERELEVGFLKTLMRYVLIWHSYCFDAVTIDIWSEL